MQAHIKVGGRIALIIDTQARNNKLDYIAIIAHIIGKEDRESLLILLDIIELTNLVYNRAYLTIKLLEVINRLNITNSIISIIRDNASLNNTILDIFKVAIEEKWDLIKEYNKLRFTYKFN